MCIFTATSAHPDYAFILASNRDEFLSRDTEPVHRWPNSSVYGPTDLGSPDKGTWMGVSESGKLAILVNFHEGSTKRSKPVLSRGNLPKDFLLSPDTAAEWYRKATRGDFDLQLYGAFTMMLVDLPKDGEANLQSIYILSNRQPIMVLPFERGTLSISNGPLMDPLWSKTYVARNALGALLGAQGEELKSGLFRLLNLEDPEHSKASDLPKNIFIRHLGLGRLDSGLYGTRTQSIVLVDRTGHVEYFERDVAASQVRDFKFPLS